MTIIKKTYTSPTITANLDDYVLAVMPFDGFYNSVHDHQFDYHMESESEYFIEEYGMTEDQASDYQCSFSFSDEILSKYCITYLEQLSIELDLKYPFIFESLESPQFYNFTTDRIFAYVHKSDIKKIYSDIDKQQLQAVISAKFTSRDGFISSYSNDLQSYNTDVLQWDYNELYALIEAHINDTLDEDWQLYIMDDPCCNGLMGELCNLGIDEEQHKIIDDLYEQKEALNNENILQAG